MEPRDLSTKMATCVDAFRTAWIPRLHVGSLGVTDSIGQANGKLTVVDYYTRVIAYFMAVSVSPVTCGASMPYQELRKLANISRSFNWDSTICVA